MKFLKGTFQRSVNIVATRKWVAPEIRRINSPKAYVITPHGCTRQHFLAKAQNERKIRIANKATIAAALH